jgi:hypothetical protein
MKPRERRPPPDAPFRYFTLIAGLFVATFLIANTTAGKLFALGPFVFPAAIVVFPLSYIFGDVLTEVYGYARSRQIIWTGFAAEILMALAYWLVLALPPASFWTQQAAFETVLGQVPRIVLASILGYLAGEFVNAYVLAKMKVWTEGRLLWTRTIGSTVAGEGVDTLLFIVVAFGGLWPAGQLLVTALSAYLFKVAYEVLATPLTYLIVGFLKRREGLDHYDVGTRFTPFRWSV